MMKHLLSIFLLSLQIVVAGSNDAFIKGETSSKRTSLEVSVSDITGTLNKAKLTIDGKSYEISGDNQTVIRDKVNGVYILIVENETHIFRMWMIPGSEKVTSKGENHYNSTFAAVIEATDPRKSEKWHLAPRITIGCSLKYSL